MREQTIVTADWIAAIRRQYGLDTRTPQAAGEAWGTHSLVAGAITALGHALDRVDALEMSMQAMTGDAAVREATKVVYSAAHLAMCNGGVLTPDQDLLRKALQAAVDVARAECFNDCPPSHCGCYDGGEARTVMRNGGRRNGKTAERGSTDNA
jgi:hypothetical protein